MIKEKYKEIIRTTIISGEFYIALFWTVILLSIIKSYACPEWKVLYILISTIGFQLSIQDWKRTW